MVHRTFIVIISITTILLLCLFAVDTYAEQGDKSLVESSDSTPLYLLTYGHGGLVLWGGDHFVQHLRNAVEWLGRYPSFKIGLENEAYTYDQMSLDYKMSQAQMTEVDLAGRELSDVSGTLNFKPWQIKTVRIKPASRLGRFANRP